jgi:hypothetical protein
MLQLLDRNKNHTMNILFFLRALKKNYETNNKNNNTYFEITDLVLLMLMESETSFTSPSTGLFFYLLLIATAPFATLSFSKRIYKIEFLFRRCILEWLGLNGNN